MRLWHFSIAEADCMLSSEYTFDNIQHQQFQQFHDLIIQKSEYRYSVLLTGVSAQARRIPAPKIIPTDLFEYLLEKCGYSFSTHIGPTRYFQKGERVISADDQTFNTIMEQFLPYFSFLVQNHSISLIEDFLPFLKAQEPNV